jgi:ubiquinone/menaquinone biosynthesis C-methylase UbiE
VDDSQAEQEALVSRYRKRGDAAVDRRYRVSNRANLLAIQQRERLTVEGLARHGCNDLAEVMVLDVGCGEGAELLRLQLWGARAQHLHGIDLIPDRARVARERLPQSDIRVGDASQLPWPDANFDLVLQLTAFSSMLEPAIRKAAAGEIARVLKPEGILLWYDFVLNPTNRDTHGVPAVELRKLSPGFSVDIHRLTLAPPLARFIAPRSWRLAAMLHEITLLQTHLLAFLRPPNG